MSKATRFPMSFQPIGGQAAEQRPVFGDYSEYKAWEKQQAEQKAAEAEAAKILHRSQMTTKERADYIAKHGAEKYLALPE